MSPSDEVGRLSRALREEIRLNGYKLTEISRAMGHHKNWLSGVLRGTTQLTALHIFQILDFLGEEPEEFFAEAYGVATFEGRQQESVLTGASSPLQERLLDALKEVGEVARQIEEIQARVASPRQREKLRKRRPKGTPSAGRKRQG